jgi:REP element-mobilizing transposase RayT
MDAANRHKHLRRLDRVWASRPVYFITACTHGRRKILTTVDAAAILLAEWKSAEDRHGWLVGRYVVMPDHVHFFVSERVNPQKTLSSFMQQWKQWTARHIAKDMRIKPPVWQSGFFDHVLRSEESYAKKWAYVRANPVRAGLVASIDEWPHQGWVHFDSPL